jgi:hypothetical protein
MEQNKPFFTIEEAAAYLYPNIKQPGANVKIYHKMQHGELKEYDASAAVVGPDGSIHNIGVKPVAKLVCKKSVFEFEKKKPGPRRRGGGKNIELSKADGGDLREGVKKIKFPSMSAAARFLDLPVYCISRAASGYEVGALTGFNVALV